MIILGAVITLIVISITLIGISGRANSFYWGQSEIVFVKTEGCLEEGLIRLKRNSAYMGGSYLVDGANCTVEVSGTGDLRTIQTNGSENNFYQHLIAEVQIAPDFGILSFSY